MNAKKFYLLLLTNVADYLVHLDVWLKYGNCCSYLDEIDEAINAYRNAVNLDSTNCEAALSLVNVLKKNSIFFEEANNVIRNSNLNFIHFFKNYNKYLSFKLQKRSTP